MPLLLLATLACTEKTPSAATHTALGSGVVTASSAAATRAAPSAASAAPASLPAGLTPATVTRVVDGDTIEVEIEGQLYKLRYIGIDTPETVDPRRPVGCYGHEASDHNKGLVLGQTVGLEKDVSGTDDFGRLLRYVWLGGEMVNAALVRDGYAVASTYPPDVKYSGLFLRLQTEAREAGRGLWGPACQTPTPIAAAGVCDYSGTSQPVIKGNINSSGQKIYHVPGESSYDATVITEAKGERYFCTESEALAAGWRKSSQ